MSSVQLFAIKRGEDDGECKRRAATVEQEAEKTAKTAQRTGGGWIVYIVEIIASHWPRGANS